MLGKAQHNTASENPHQMGLLSQFYNFKYAGFKYE